jgi:hypothetical protein
MEGWEESMANWTDEDIDAYLAIYGIGVCDSDGNQA